MPLNGVDLQLAVVGDAAIATQVEIQRGEWNAQTGGEFHVRSMTEAQLAAADGPAVDAVICPSCELGPLAQRKLLATMPKETMHGPAGDWAAVFELPRLREAAWGPDVMGVSFGSPVFCCYYRADLLEKLGRQPPQTWAEYQQLAQLLADGDNLDGVIGKQADTPGEPSWCGTIEPLGPGWGGLVLLARAAPYAKSRDNYSTLFNIETMQPLVAGPPFVRALEELVAASKFGPTDPLAYDPTSAREAFWQGRCSMALSWPAAADKVSPGDEIHAGIAPLPGSSKVYNVGVQSWEERLADEDPHVPLLGIAGRLGVVLAKGQHRQAAFELLLWLSGEQLSPTVCAASPATTLFRRAHVESPQPWVERPMSDAVAGQYARQTQATLGRQQWLFAPRIPGRAEYLAALDEAVRQAVVGKRSAAEALQQAAARWQAITERLGMESQKTAYRHSLGLP